MAVDSYGAMATSARANSRATRFGYTPKQVVAIRWGFLAAFVGGIAIGAVLTLAVVASTQLLL